jgi:hypothetical protein
MHYPILLTEEEYQSGSEYQIKISYKWFNSHARDYTVKVYSKMDIPIYMLDKDTGAKTTSVIHMDGTAPSGF